MPRGSILVVDDEVEIREGLDALLTSEDFRVTLAETGQAYASGASLQEAQKQVAKILVPRYAAKFDPAFPQSVTANITKAYQVIAFAN